MRPDQRAQPGYLEAFTKVIAKIVATLENVDPDLLPIKLYVAGGAALHLRTGSRVTADIDAVFSQRVVIHDDLKASYRDTDGRARLLYFDRSYNDTFGLLHPDAYRDSEHVDLQGIDNAILEVRALSPLDLAVSKLSRFSDQDREDIEILARNGLIDAKTLRERAEEALEGYVGDIKPVRTTIEMACKLVEAIRKSDSGAGKKGARTNRP